MNFTRLVVVGAGPKAVAITAKAKVLKELHLKLKIASCHPGGLRIVFSLEIRNRC